MLLALSVLTVMRWVRTPSLLLGSLMDPLLCLPRSALPERPSSSRRFTRVLAAFSFAWACSGLLPFLDGGAALLDDACPMPDELATPPGFGTQGGEDLGSPIPVCRDFPSCSPQAPGRVFPLPPCPPLPSFGGVSPRALSLKRNFSAAGLDPSAGPKPQEEDTVPFSVHVEAHQMPSHNSTLIDLIDGDTRDLLPQYSPVSECVDGTLLDTLYFDDFQGGEISIDPIPPAQHFPPDCSFSYSQLSAPQYEDSHDWADLVRPTSSSSLPVPTSQSACVRVCQSRPASSVFFLARSTSLPSLLS